MADLRLVLIKPQNGLYGFTFDQSDTGLRAAQVTSVLPSGAAAQAGLEPGHLIVSVGDTPVDGLTVHQVQSLIDETTSRLGEVALYVSSRDQLNRLARSVDTASTTTTTTTTTGKFTSNAGFQPCFDSAAEGISDRPSATSTFAQPDVTSSSEVNLRVVRKEAYRTGPYVDGSSALTDGSLSPSSAQTDQRHPTNPLPATCSSSPTLQISFKPRHTNLRTTARFTSPSGLYGSHKPQLGAVASLAIDGGLSPDQLLHIGCAGTETTSRSPPAAVSSSATSEPVEDSAATISPGRATGTTTTTRHIHPTYATHQPILLSRTFPTGAGGGDGGGSGSIAFRGPSRAHIRIPSWSSSRGYCHHPFHVTNLPMSTVYSGSTPRRGSFPMQMTRVGGLVLGSRDSTQPMSNQVQHDPGASGTYQSLSACTSPTSVKHPSDSSSPSRGTTFFSSSVPSPANTPPLPPITTGVSVTAPISCVDIVRLGPGDTITHALPGDTHYTAHSLIRMHCCPQPYVSLCPTGSRASDVPSSGTPPWFTCETGGTATAAQPTDRVSSQTFSLLSSLNAPVVSQPGGTTIYQHSSSTRPGDQATVIADSRLANPTDFSLNPQSPTSQSPLLHAMPVSVRSSAPMSHTGPQVARTVRHLRRIRHIFGDSLGYVSSVTSASMGTLAAAEKNCTSTNSLVELRSHGSRSVESVRPASLVYKCPEPACILEAELAADRFTETLFSLDPDTDTTHTGPAGTQSSSQLPQSPPQVMVRFEQLPAQYEHCKCPTAWERYCALLVDDTLRLTRLVSHGQVDEPNAPPAHLHLPLVESSLTWHSPSDLSDLGLPAGTRWATGDSVLGFLRVPSTRIQCQLFFLHRSVASFVLGQWGPTASSCEPIVTDGTTTQAGSVSITAQQQQQQQGTTSRQFTRSKPATGRSSSLGLAGPPGGVPLFRAMGTAAASVGMPLVGRSSLSSWFQPGSQKSAGGGGELGTDSINGEVAKETTSNASAPVTGSKGSKKQVTSTAQVRSSRGRFHQAFTRMRRAATASSAPTARSPSRNAGTRRFASSHGALASSKSSVSTTPHTGSPLSVLDQPDESNVTRLDTVAAVGSGGGGSHGNDSAYLHTTPESVARSSPALLLATSVSPSPALLSPYLTYLPSETTASAEDRLYVDTSNLDRPPATTNEYFSSESSSEPLGHPVTQEDGARPSRTKRFGSSELLTVTSSSSVSASGTVTKLSTTEVAAPHLTASLSPSVPHPFIPLPVPKSGPLALHKCPRSTLSPFVPFIVEFCVTLVERYGLNCVGIYRLSGSKVAHDFISTELRKNLNEIDVTSDKWNDIHAICGVLKTFLRNLPDSLFPKVMYTDFLSACRVPQREKRLLSIQRLLSIMECYPDHPEYRAHRATLRYLATHLARVSAREAVNKMTAYNLALVFAPNLVQPCEDSPELLMSDSKYKIMLVETVIKYHAWIFSPDLGLESGCSVPTDSSEELPATAGQSVTAAAPAAATQSSEMPTEMPSRSAAELGTSGLNSLDSEDPTHQPGRLEGDVQPLVAELLSAAASLPPPPSDTDLETAEEPGPASDRPSDIAMDMARGQPVSSSQPRPRFTSIPTTTWSAAALQELQEGSKLRPELILTLENMDVDEPGERQEVELNLSTSLSITTVSATTTTSVAPGSSSVGESSGIISRPRPFTTHLGTKLDNLRHLSQGCLDQYTTEARQLGVRVAESRRQLQTTVAQRLQAEQLLMEARGQQTDVDLGSPEFTGYAASQRRSASPNEGSSPVSDPPKESDQ